MNIAILAAQYDYFWQL